MKQVIFPDTSGDIIPFDKIDANTTPIFVKKNGKLYGMVTNEAKSGEQTRWAIQYGYTYHIED